MMGAPAVATANNGQYNIRDFGARGDGVTLDTGAINAAIEAAAKAGGGTIRVPAGTYLCLSIHLQSNIRLHLDAGATIEAATGTPERGYDAPKANDFKEYQDYGHSHFRNSLIWGENLENVTIDGPGEINGKGLRHSNGPKDVGTANKAIALKLCRNVTMKDFTMRRGGWFAILATGVDNLTIDNLKIDTNRDGMDIDCCRNVRISNCSVNAPGDDAICLKSSYALNEARATENVTISNCLVSGYKVDTMLNGKRLYDYQEKPGRQPQRAHQVRHGIERRLQEHHDFQLYFREVSRSGPRNRGRRIVGRCDDQQHHHARRQQRADLSALGAPDARAGRRAGRQTAPRQYF